MITDRIGRHKVLLPISHRNYGFLTNRSARRVLSSLCGVNVTSVVWFLHRGKAYIVGLSLTVSYAYAKVRQTYFHVVCEMTFLRKRLLECGISLWIT